MKSCQQSCRSRRRARIGKGVSRQRTSMDSKRYHDTVSPLGSTVREEERKSQRQWLKKAASRAMVGDGKGMYHYKVCKAIRIDVCSYSHIYVYTAIQECTYMTIWKYRNTTIKICRYIERKVSTLYPTMWAVSASLCPSAFGSFFLWRAGR